jgi:hypothetical protein
MSPKLKRLGAGLVAVVALSLVASASAPAAQFTAAKYPTSYEVTGGESSGSISNSSGSMTCKKLTASGTASAASSTVTVNSTASECTAFGAYPSHVIMNGCYYTFHVTEGSGDKFKGTGDIVCPAGKEISITPTTFGVSVCSIRIPAQTGGMQMEFINDTANSRVEGKMLSQTSHYTGTGGVCGSGEQKDGKVTPSVNPIVGGKEKSAAIS